MVYLDQPVGTGFSTAPKNKKTKKTKYNTTQKEVAINFYTFLRKFLDKYPDLKKRDLYLTGESYAGHFIPNTALWVKLQKNPDINIKGLIIGSGMVDPGVQYGSIINYSKHHNLLKGLKKGIFL